DHDVFIQDPRPRSPLIFPRLRTDLQGRVTFDRLAAGRYRVLTTAIDRCATVVLPTSILVAVPENGTIEKQLIVGGRAALRITSPLGPAMGVLISAAPNTAQAPMPFAPPSSSFGCRGATDRDGRVTLENFPPGPAHVAVPMGNSTYVRQI